MVKAIANECGANFLSVKGSIIIDKSVESCCAVQDMNRWKQFVLTMNADLRWEFQVGRFRIKS